MKRKIGQWLEAIEELRRHYEKYESDDTPCDYGEINSFGCPLCAISENKDCTDCLWVLFEEGICSDLNFREDITRERLIRLDRWEKKLKKMKINA